MTESAITPSKKPLIELHFPDREIDNPTVLTRLCLQPEMLNRISTGLEQGYGYAILIVARNPEDTRSIREIREIRDPLHPTSFIEFPKAGTWEVGVFLFERKSTTAGKNTTYLLERSMHQSMKNEHLRRSWPTSGRYVRDIPDFSEIAIDYRELGKKHMFYANAHTEYYGVAIAMNTVTLTMPQEIFAREPSPWVKGFANYFFKHAPYDECELRSRLLWMIPGVLPWFFLEFWKRVFCFLGGIILLLFAVRGSGHALKRAFSLSPRLSYAEAYSEVRDAVNEQRGQDLFVWPFRNRWWGGFLSPGALIVEAALLTMVAALLYEVGMVLYDIVSFFGSHLSVVVGVITGIALVIGLVFFYAWFVTMWHAKAKERAASHTPSTRVQSGDMWDRLIVFRNGVELSRLRRREQRTVDYGRSQATFVQQQAAVLVCGDAPKEVSLSAVPSQVITLRTRFLAVKRQVCRPFG